MVAAWQDIIGSGLVILIGLAGAVGYVHKTFASKSAVKETIDALVKAGADRFEATKDATRAVCANVARVERQLADLRELLDRILLARAGK